MLSVMAKLQETLQTEFGRRTINNVEMPDYFETGINPNKRLRPYQKECFQYFLTYMNPENIFDGKAKRPHLLFHMATGSGKTLQMAGAMLYLYNQGYRNFLFFVGNTNIVEKTKDNFLNPSSAKYMFASFININGRRVEINEVKNFQGVNGDCLNLCLTTIQGLHSDLNTEKEDAITYEDFSDRPIVLIADEAHHLNAVTKREPELTVGEKEERKNWEATINNIFNKDNGHLPNVLLEFTATMDLANPAIARKYEDKLIFDYPLKKFREDKYSKDVETIETDLSDLDRALQAMVLSQYKRKLFGELRLNIKPVVLMKSKKIRDNKEIFEQFKTSVKSIDAAGIDRIRQRANGDLKSAFDYFDAHDINDQNLAIELQEDFSEERLLLVDGNNITPEKQHLLNTLEDDDNEIRAVFAVDMLNEGWDVLNLYDIVRLYDTRDAANGRPGKTTMQEAQLIGRGARYMPFIDPNNTTLPIDRRKYDGDASNPYRVIEKLHYHSAHNPRYIQELRTAMIQTGIIEDKRVPLDLFMKPEFKRSRLYDKGKVFVNEQKSVAETEDDGTIGSAILEKVFKVTMYTGKMNSNQVFGDNAPCDMLTTITISAFDFIKVGKHVVRSAMNSYSTFSYDSLHKLYPQLKSCREFVESDNYLAKLQVSIIGKYNTLEEYSQSDKLYIAKEVLKQLEPLLITRGKTKRGTKLFVPKEFKKAFRDKIVLNVTVTDSDQEFGKPQKNPANQEYAIDLTQHDWYAYNENYGTSEEKALVKYIESIMPRLKEKYDEIYLVRNEKDVKIYSFDEGRPFEPDFLLFLRLKGVANKYDNLQIFIEPKGNHLLIADKWKEDFLRQITELDEITWMTSTDYYDVWGLPFFNESTITTFTNAFDKSIIDRQCHEEELPPTTFPIIDSSISDSQKFTTHLPVYPLRAACGYFDDCGQLQDEEAEGWLDVSEYIHSLNNKMFIVYAEGDSMMPKIHDGDLCVFDATKGGSREGKIVLTKAKDKDCTDASSFTIKKYHSEKSINEDETWQHLKVTLCPLNSAYEPIVIDANDTDEDEFTIYGELIHVFPKGHNQ